MTAIDLTTKDGRSRRVPPLHRWIFEIGLIVGIYAAYTAVRNSLGSAIVPTDVALRNASRIVHLERAMGIFTEASLQDWAFAHEWLIRLANFWYRAGHFWITIGVLVFLFVRKHGRYPLARNVLLCTTVLALVGFALFPLAPPRLLPEEFGFVDTARVASQYWTADAARTAFSHASNQFAAMPSLHIGWALWVVWAVWPVVGRLGRGLALAHLTFSVVTVVITGNHYLLDAMGGAAVLSAGWLAGHVVTNASAGIRARYARTATAERLDTADTS